MSDGAAPKRPAKQCRAVVLPQVGCTAEGKLVALKIDLYNNGGNSLDLSASVMDRALLHCENSYLIPNVHAQGYVCRTNTASNTAFRGFGGPQVCCTAFFYDTSCDDVLSLLHQLQSICCGIT